MEFNFSLPLLSGGISTISASTLALLSADELERLRVVIDSLGRRSCVAQKLNQPITSLTKLIHSDHVIHVCSERQDARRTLVVGFIKTGRKTLFVYHDSPVMREIQPQCVLDFYVVSQVPPSPSHTPAHATRGRLPPPDFPPLPPPPSALLLLVGDD